MTAPSTTKSTYSIELSIVMPCLNEADTLAVCIQKATKALAGDKISGEIIVADNGSTDGSQAIAEREGARVVNVTAKGYGHALMGGINAARGKYVLMGDADDSYDFLEAPKFVARLREGYDLVQGCRLPSGGGHIADGAMPFLHRWLGNPMFSFLARWWFHAPIHDIYCGMRAFTKEWFEKLDQRCTGMEFATEMIIKSSFFGAKTAEVPITLHPDGRKAHAPHLKTFRDGWRTIRFFLMLAPKWLFLAPGISLICLGAIGYAIALPGFQFGPVIIGPHSLMVATLAIICGYQSVLFAIFAKTFAVTEGIMPADTRLNKFFKLVNLEKGILVGSIALLTGLALLAMASVQWMRAGFGPLDYEYSMRVVIPGALLIVLGFQTNLSSFFVSILGMQRR